MSRLAPILTYIIFLSACANASDDSKDAINSPDLTQSLSLQDTLGANGVTFQVDSVEIATNLLPIYPIESVIRNNLRRPISYLPNAQDSLQIAPIHGNGLVWTVQECYDKHRPLILSPDVIWLTICQGVSIHANLHFDSLKSVLFNENRPDKVIARNDSLAENADAWAHLITDLADQTKAYTLPGIHDFFVPQYSTTSPAATMAYQINLLETYEKAFTYIGESGCGIPSITLEGYKKDWEAIYDRLDQLDDFGLSVWKENLKPIIEQFIATYDGNINVTFWKDIYKNAIEYNGFYISGWIIKFFPYIKVNDTYDMDADFVDYKGYKAGISYIPNRFFNGSDYLMSTLSTKHFPVGISEIDLEWRDYYAGTTTDMQIKGGFFGMEQLEDKSLKPFISWAVIEKNAKEIPYKNKAYHIDTLVHTDDYWSPKIIEKLQDSAIYHHKQFDSQASSLIHVQSVLTEAIKKNPKTKSLVLDDNSIEFVVLSNGALSNFRLIGSASENQELLALLSSELTHLPHPWFPATAYPNDVLRLMHDFDEPPNIKVNANSLVRIDLN